MNDVSSTEHIEEQAALYALGALSQHEASAFTERLAEDNVAYAAELQPFERVVATLGFSAPEAVPSSLVRERLLSNIAATPRTAKSVPAAPLTNQLVATRYREIHWKDCGNGVLAKLLFKDPVARTITTLYKLAPGTTFTEHTHPGAEQCFILEGDFIVNGECFGPGDFHCATRGSTHQHITTTQGTTLLVITPADYRMG
ncbi:MAG: cupin domain-containing protein [Acidobacteria bacterium]|nr:cupin domain-containing protein [Acidobacteriota bacterium]MBI3425365.1 cupin domain-containing protein [Acidobacteriota bacterium]